MDHAEVMNGCDAKARRLGLKRLSAVERAVVLVSRANCEISNGGLSAFYYNSAGDEAVRTVEALEAVGATAAASALREANALFPRRSPSRDREKRFAGLEVIRKRPERPLESLDDRFYGEKPDAFTRLCAYIEAHADELREYDVA